MRSIDRIDHLVHRNVKNNFIKLVDVFVVRELALAHVHLLPLKIHLDALVQLVNVTQLLLHQVTVYRFSADIILLHEFLLLLIYVTEQLTLTHLLFLLLILIYQFIQQLRIIFVILSLFGIVNL